MHGVNEDCAAVAVSVVHSVDHNVDAAAGGGGGRGQLHGRTLRLSPLGYWCATLDHYCSPKSDTPLIH